MFNPYVPYGAGFPQRYEVIHVNGEGGARALQMAANSSAILMDDTAPLVWLAQTDGAGYKTVTPFKIEPYKPQTQDDVLKAMDERIKRLEGMLNESHVGVVTKAEREQYADTARKHPTDVGRQSRNGVSATDAE